MILKNKTFFFSVLLTISFLSSSSHLAWSECGELFGKANSAPIQVAPSASQSLTNIRNATEEIGTRLDELAISEPKPTPPGSQVLIKPEIIIRTLRENIQRYSPTAIAVLRELFAPHAKVKTEYISRLQTIIQYQLIILGFLKSLGKADDPPTALAYLELGPFAHLSVAPAKELREFVELNRLTAEKLFAYFQEHRTNELLTPSPRPPEVNLREIIETSKAEAKKIMEKYDTLADLTQLFDRTWEENISHSRDDFNKPTAGFEEALSVNREQATLIAMDLAVKRIEIIERREWLKMESKSSRFTFGTSELDLLIFEALEEHSQ